MTGAELYAYLVRRLAESGLTLEAGRSDTLYDALTEGRDVVKGELALVAPALFAPTVALEVDSADLNQYRIPAATKDPLRVTGLFLVDGDGERVMLTPAAQLNRDDGDYVLTGPRKWRLRRGLSIGTGTLEIDAVLHDAAITVATTEANIGLPTPCHRAIGLSAAVRMLTVDEESDAAVAERLYERELLRLENLYGSYDMNDGMKLRHAIMASEGSQYGDMLP